MDCFNAKLALRHSHLGVPNELSLDTFDHLFLCRSCWAYANYLWHHEALESHPAEADEETQEERLEQAWNRRHERAGALPALTPPPSGCASTWTQAGKLPS